MELNKLEDGGQPFTDKVSFNFRGTGGKESIIPFGLKAIRFIQRTSRVKCAAVRCKLGQQYVIRFSRPLLPIQARKNHLREVSFITVDPRGCYISNHPFLIRGTRNNCHEICPPFSRQNYFRGIQKNCSNFFPGFRYNIHIIRRLIYE